MAIVKNPENIIDEIQVEDLLKKALELKKSGYRFSQACAAFVNEKFELSYSFSDYESYQLYNLRLVIDTDVVVPSITEIVPAAVFYENEMKELFGVKIEMINLDFEDKLYRIKEKQPLGPKDENKEEE